MSVAYDGNPPYITGVHYGGDGIGVNGSRVSLSGTAAQSVIASALAAAPVTGVEYRLYSGNIPAGVTLFENGGGTYTGLLRQVSIDCTLAANGVELA